MASAFAFLAVLGLTILLGLVVTWIAVLLVNAIRIALTRGQPDAIAHRATRTWSAF